MVISGGNIFIFYGCMVMVRLCKHWRLLNSVDGGSVGYLIVSRCLMEAVVIMITMCVISLCV